MQLKEKNIGTEEAHREGVDYVSTLPLARG